MRCSSRTPLCLIELWDDAAGFRAHRRRHHRHDTHRRRRRSIFGINLSLFLSLERSLVVTKILSFVLVFSMVIPFFLRKKKKTKRREKGHVSSRILFAVFFFARLSKKTFFFWLFFCEIFVLLFFVFRSQNACAHFFKMRVPPQKFFRFFFCFGYKSSKRRLFYVFKNGSHQHVICN